MSQGSVSPWPTSVATITQKVRNRIRSRDGKSGGSARAAASETTPRMPAQDTMNTARGGGYGSRSRMRRLRKRGR